MFCPCLSIVTPSCHPIIWRLQVAIVTLHRYGLLLPPSGTVYALRNAMEPMPKQDNVDTAKYSKKRKQVKTIIADCL